MTKRDIILSTVKKRIKSVDPKAKIILFGSRARNDAKKDSDWDFLILTETTPDRIFRNKIYDELFELELETDEVVTGIIQNIESWNEYSNTPIYQNILRDGVEV
ncbi:MAG: nucleotidyltransferase domain-containing protein [Mariniphaga sp.]|nr:nucleotidyltransferase domain-containing protein [Mariniphaga sp.]